jgi:hypothetical protein
MGKAKVTCILDKRRLSGNQLTFARKRDTRKRAPSELFQSVFLTFPLPFSFNLPSQSARAAVSPQGEPLSSALFPSFSLTLLRRISFFMAKPPLRPDRLPTLEYSGVSIEPIIHHGFSRPDRGPATSQSRFLFGARDKAGERHWRSSYEEIVTLIHNGFTTASLSSGVTL